MKQTVWGSAAAGDGANFWWPIQQIWRKADSQSNAELYRVAKKHCKQLVRVRICGFVLVRNFAAESRSEAFVKLNQSLRSRPSLYFIVLPKSIANSSFGSE